MSLLVSFFVLFAMRCSPAVVANDINNDTSGNVSGSDANKVSATDQTTFVNSKTSDVKTFSGGNEGKAKIEVTGRGDLEIGDAKTVAQLDGDSKKKAEPESKDASGRLIEALSNKDYVTADKILCEMGTLTDELKDLHISVLDKLGEHERAVKYWQEKVLHFNKSQGIQITDLEFCRRIHAHGRFEVIDGDEFNPGSAILLYIEVKNYQFKDEAQGHKLRLEYNWELYDALNNKLQLWQNVGESVRYDDILFQNRVSEYSQSFLLPLPKNIAGGVYTLKVSVKDINSGLSHMVEKKLRIKFITE